MDPKLEANAVKFKTAREGCTDILIVGLIARWLLLKKEREKKT